MDSSYSSWGSNNACPSPTNLQSLMYPLDMYGYSRSRDPNLVDVSSLLVDHPSPKTKLYSLAFHRLRGPPSSHPVLRSPDPSLSYRWPFQDSCILSHSATFRNPHTVFNLRKDAWKQHPPLTTLSAKQFNVHLPV